MSTQVEREQRTILPNCCEDWILEYGKMYAIDSEFTCLPCGHRWSKKALESFVELATNTVYKTVWERGLRYLQPEQGPEPMLKRCCSNFFRQYGPRITTAIPFFECPYCYTMWRVEETMRYGIRHRIFTNQNTGFQFILVEYPTASYLQPIAHVMEQST